MNEHFSNVLISLFLCSVIVTMFYFMWSNPAGDIKTVDSKTKSQTITSDSVITTIIFTNDSTYFIITPRRK